MKIQLRHSFEEIISLENFLAAWDEFISGKRNKPDVQEFTRNLMDNIFALRDDLKNSTYQHGGYHSFSICDPKPRNIHKARVRDRLLHHAIYRFLYPFFDRAFIADSFSCRDNKGVHKAINRFRAMAYKVSRNNIRTCWVLKCDIRKFFANIDHGVLLQLLQSYIPDNRIMNLLERVIKSFETIPGKGLPLGNLTSQLFANVYMNDFDQFIKYRLKVKHYIRYADDFLLLAENREYLLAQLSCFGAFLQDRLRLELHPKKIELKTFASGIDFLGWVHFSHHRVLRMTTKRRMMRRISENATKESAQSYIGLLKHGDAFALRQEVLNQYWLWQVH